MSLFADEAYLGADFVEIPCEFCNELYPFELLMEHQSGCRPDLLHFNNEDEVAPIAAAASRLPSPPKVVEAKQKVSSIIPNVPIPSPFSKGTNISDPVKQNKDVKKINPFEDLLTDDEEAPLIFEDTSQETETKLMSYGSNLAKRIEEEKPSFRPPPLPLFNDQNDKKDESNVLSDDENESGECLEDFWRRADIKNTQRLRKLKI